MSSEPPDWMKYYAGQGTEKIGFDDCIWPGVEGEEDVLVALERGPQLRPMISLLLQGISEAHPLDGVSSEKRLELALNALIGTPITKGPGGLNDDRLLVEVAREDLRQRMGFASKTSLSAIIKHAAYTVYPELKKSDDIKRDEAIVRRVKPKYERDREQLFLTVNTTDFAERRKSWVLLDRALEILQQLGIAVRRSIIPGSPVGD